jgi:Protein of unknown function (DUF4019)
MSNRRKAFGHGGIMILQRSLISFFLVLFLFAAYAIAGQSPEQSAQQAAESWLGLTDAGKYAESWNQAGEIFRSAITKDQWVKTIHAVRGPLGKLLSRSLRSAEFTTALPGAPDGQYVVIQYQTVFERKRAAIETITPMLENDGKWRVSGYYIK